VHGTQDFNINLEWPGHKCQLITIFNHPIHRKATIFYPTVLEFSDEPHLKQFSIKNLSFLDIEEATK
jgi:hypothetical protein